MNSYYQMTMEEMLSDGKYKPIKHKQPSGKNLYMCPICEKYVGLYDTGRWYPDDKGWLERKVACSFGHIIDWSDEPPLET